MKEEGCLMAVVSDEARLGPDDEEHVMGCSGQ